MAGIPLVIIGLTGSLLVFSEELEHFRIPIYYRLLLKVSGYPHSLWWMLPTVHPDLLPHRITVQTPEQVYTVMMVSPQDEYTDVYVNPYNAEVLGSRP